MFAPDDPLQRLFLHDVILTPFCLGVGDDGSGDFGSCGRKTARAYGMKEQGRRNLPAFHPESMQVDHGFFMSRLIKVRGFLLVVSPARFCMKPLVVSPTLSINAARDSGELSPPVPEGSARNACS